MTGKRLYFLVLPNNEKLHLLGLFDNTSNVWGEIILIHLICNISALVSQGQDKFVFGETVIYDELPVGEFSCYQRIINL